MNWLKMLLAGAAVGVILVAFRDSANERWLIPARIADDETEELEEEPVLGYDGMDQETLLDWLNEANLDRSTLLRLRSYEEQNLGRATVLDAVDELL